MKLEIKQRVAALRKFMQGNGIQAFILPTTDPHNSEYVASHWEARKWLTGFTGSAGTAVITMKKAGLWTDSRYFLQAAEQLEGTDITLFKERMPETPSIAEWLFKELKEGDIIGMDGWVNGIDFKESLYEACSPKGIQVKSVTDPFDEIWEDRPALPSEPVFILEEKYAGLSCRKKIELIREEIHKNNCQSILLSALDEIAWTLNLRGSDVHCNPVFISYMHITQKEATLYIIEEKLSPEVKTYLEENGVTIKSYNKIESDIKNVRQNIQVSPTLNMKLFNAAGYPSSHGIDTGHKIMEIPSPVSLLKAIKNETEINGFRHAMERDGIAMVKFLKWLKEAVPAGNESELSVDRKLYELRAEQANFKGISFDTIAGYKEHAAMMHYSATEESDYELKQEGMLLVDSGGQYYTGTTDITRTYILGDITEEQKLHYTSVLRGMIRLSKAKFLYGCRGLNLDILARGPLWDIGIDYKCGTGHGIGFVSNVHEGPNGFRWKIVPERNDSCIFEEGMVTTNEPGVYIEGSHGIRIENELICQRGPKVGVDQFMEFETITFAPIDLDGVNPEYMEKSEIAWLNNYHEQVFEKISPYLNEEEVEWLKKYTRAI